MEKQANKGYNETLNLPNTSFAMKASLAAREPEILGADKAKKLYFDIQDKHKNDKAYILHDGPPFANGDIHLGHALNKILKDIVMRYKALSGYRTPYVPGWDMHGLPIELQVLKQKKVDRNKDVVEFRNICRDFAVGYAKTHAEQFQRLGVLGDWDHPYYTIHPEFEEKQVRIFGKMALQGLVYKGMKPVYWCSDCETALAEAEIEYNEDKTTSIYVKFKVKSGGEKLIEAAGADNVYFVIWTTTTWTLPANLAICLGPDFEYCIVKAGGEAYVVAKELASRVMEAAGIEDYEITGSFTGKELEYTVAQHPFLNRESLVIVGDHVTLESGSGCVHTAPGHGLEDYEVCRNYKELPIVVPVDSKGVMTAEAGRSAGLPYYKANAEILEELKENGALLASQDMIHQYPHCWRCKKPVIFRATEQWFASVDKFKSAALAEIKKTRWIPEWGEDRIASMVSDRSDWCISRQRAWGVPIPIFTCEDCEETIITPQTIDRIATIFGREGSSAWFSHTVEELLPEGFICPKCGGRHISKEKDIMDVWFDSGSSHSSVLETRPELSRPADLYLEGNDQYRGWFQSSLLTSVAAFGNAPYKTVVTHGMIVDENGKKMSKSLGNTVVPMEFVSKYGADVLRLWVSSADYRTDMRMGAEITKQLGEAYRKIRNTARFILGNISDFNPDTDSKPYSELSELDRWVLMKLSKLIAKARVSYENFEFHTVYHAIHHFCVVDMSNFYLDICKDTLYVEKKDSIKRRCVQTVLWTVLDSLVRLIAPILAFTSEEIWEVMPKRASDQVYSVMLSDMAESHPDWENFDEAKWENIMLVRDQIKLFLEKARASKLIGASLDAKVYVGIDDSDKGSADFAKLVREYAGFLPELLIVSRADVVASSAVPSGAEKDGVTGLYIAVAKADGEKCMRCWTYSDTVSCDHDHTDVCARCAAVLK